MVLVERRYVVVLVLSFFVLNEFELDAIKYVLNWEASCSSTVKIQNNIAYIENAEAVESTQLVFVC